MDYISLYRKWRPQLFSEVVGQQHVVRTLTNALDQRRIGHAYLFSGPRGTGKTTIARLLAKGLNCQTGPTGSPCGQCDACTRIATGHSVDVLEIDGASNRGIDEIREIRERVKYAPAESAYKVYIIDEVHMLTTEAFNALLKVLEEPPAHVVFVFATTEHHKIPATILSRCQNFNFQALTADDMMNQLRHIAQGENAAIDDEALALIVRHADGGMRDAIGFLDQSIAFAEGAIDEELVAQVLGVVGSDILESLAEALIEKDIRSALLLVQDCVDSGRDIRQWASDAARYFRDLTLLALMPEGADTLALTKDDRARRLDLAKRLGTERLLRVVQRFGRAESDMRYARSASLVMELALIELIQHETEPSAASASQRGTAAPTTSAALEALYEGDGGQSPPQTSGTPSFPAMQSLIKRIETLERQLAGAGGRPAAMGGEAPVAREPAGASAATTSPASATPTDKRVPLWASSPSSEARADGGVASSRQGDKAASAPRATPGDELVSADASTRQRGADEVAADKGAPATEQGATQAETNVSSPTSPTEAPEATPTGDDVALAQRVRDQWPELLEALRTRKAMQQAAFLREGVPGEVVHGDTVLVYFSENHQFHKTNIEDERNKNIVETVLSTLIGDSLHIRPVTGTAPEVLGSGDVPTGPGGGAPPAAKADEGKIAAAAQTASPPQASAPQASAPETPTQTLGPSTATADSSASKGTDTGAGNKTSDGETLVGADVDEAVLNEPIVKKALELFGGTITKIERKDVETS